MRQTPIMAIYCIRNLVNNKVYIGSAIDYRRRWRQHLHEFKTSKHDNKHLLRSWSKHGEENFSFEVVEYVGKKEDLIPREQNWIDFFQPEYNIRKKAENNLGLTWKLSPEECIKHSERQKGRKLSPEHAAKVRVMNIGRVKTTEMRLNISLAKKGKKASPEGEKRRIDAIKASALRRRTLKLVKNDQPGVPR